MEYRKYKVLMTFSMYVEGALIVEAASPEEALAKAEEIAEDVSSTELFDLLDENVDPRTKSYGEWGCSRRYQGSRR